MTADCVLTSPLIVEESIELNIVGGGFTITRGSSFTAVSGSDSFIVAVPSAGRTPSVALANVTLDAENKFGVSTQLISVGLNVHSLTTNFVSFLNAPSGAWGGPPNGGSWSLNNVLFRGSRAAFSSLSPESPASALHIKSGGVALFSGVVFENNLFGIGALKIDSGGTVTVAGCVSDVANIPKFVAGTIGATLTPCTGSVGNGHTIETRTATPQPCGYPTGGEVRGTTTFTLRSNCATTDWLFVTEGVTLTIDGEGHAITGDPPQVTIVIGEGSRVNLNDVALHGIRFLNLGHIEGELVAFYPPLTHRAITSLGTVNINKLLMERLDFTNLGAFGMALYTQSPPATNPSPGDVTIEDAIFKDITNGASAATLFSWYSGATITLNGCITDENNVPALNSAGGGSTFTDNRDPDPCPDDFIYEFPGKRRLTTPTTDGPPRGDSGAGPSDSEGAAKPVISTCLTLPGIQVSGISQSTQCQRVDAVGIANPGIGAGDYVDAVDVWSWVLPNTQICFEASGGGIKFIDTAIIPRTVHDLEAHSLNGLTCAEINGPGMVVLLPGDPPPARNAASGSAPTATTGQSLSGCMVRATASLNLRASPGGAVIGGVGESWLLTAVERTAGWFRVDRLGEYGWISADYVETEGTCG